ncbi:MAG: hypothetical protein WCP65_03435 [Bacteroidota bacterium]
MKQTILSLIVIFLSFNLAFSQDTIHLKTTQRHKVITDRCPQLLFAELGGPGILSANYDFRFNKTTDGLGARIGMGYFTLGTDNSITTIPIGLNYLLGNNGKFFEVGINETFLMAHFSNSTFSFSNNSINTNVNFTTMCLGYRSQPDKGGFNFRGGLMPIFFQGNTGYSIYLSFGFNF